MFIMVGDRRQELTVDLRMDQMIEEVGYTVAISLAANMSEDGETP